MGVLINLKRYTLMKRETKEWDGNRRKIIIQVLAIREGKKKKKKKKKKKCNPKIYVNKINR